MSRIPLDVAATICGVKPATLRQWVTEGHISAPIAGCYDLAEVTRQAEIWLKQVAYLRADIEQRALPRYELLNAADLARLVHIDVGTVYVWRNRGILTNRWGRYDWREATVWLMERDPGKISEPTAKRAAL